MPSVMKYLSLLLSASSITAAALQCDIPSIQATLPSNATVLFAQPQAQNASFGNHSDIAYPTNATGLPAFCAVVVNVTSSAISSFTFGLALPNEWNDRYLAVGNGGFAGGINWLDLGAGLQYGFAVMSTDTGHNSTSGDGTWGLNKERLADWGYRAMHGSIVLSKQIVSAYYAQPIKYSYYSGCSTGGRQGLKEIQLYPDSFDGVLAGAPAWWTNHLQPWTTWIGKINANPNGTNPAAIPASLFPAIRAEVLRQCDPVDGLMDGIITNPYMCDFHPDALLCQGTNTTNCLTGLQLETLYTIQHDYLENATFVFPHLALGSEAQWPVLLGNPNGPASLGTQYEQYFLLDDPTWNWEDFDYSIIQQADQQDPGNATANDFDLSPFHALGGKLIQYHGLSDGLIPTGSSIYFYKHVMRALAPLGIDLSSWYRFFLVPGMQHCNFGVNDAPWYFAGANQAGPLNTSLHSVPGFSDARHDALLALMAWAEQGIAPDQIIATKWLNDTPSLGVVRQRPLCPYPTVPQYTGSGSVNASDSFVCAALPFKVPVVVQGGQGGAQSVLTVTQTQTEVVSVTASVQCTGTATQAGEWGWPWQGSSTLKAWPGRPTAAGWR